MLSNARHKTLATYPQDGLPLGEHNLLLDPTLNDPEFSNFMHLNI